MEIKDEITERFTWQWVNETLVGTSVILAIFIIGFALGGSLIDIRSHELERGICVIWKQGE